MVSNSLVLQSQVAQVPCRVRILHVSGTLQKTEEKMKLMGESWLSNQEKQIEIIESTLD